MITKAITCDKCRESIEAGRTKLKATRGGLPSRRRSVDLCVACSGAFDAWLDNRGGLTAPPAGTPPMAGKGLTGLNASTRFQGIGKAKQGNRLNQL